LHRCAAAGLFIFLSLRERIKVRGDLHALSIFDLWSGNQTSNIEHQTFVKIVLAYSGGLDTSIILRWLKDNYQAEIIAFCADIGQQEELDGLEEKAMHTGAAKCYIDNLQEEFARDFIF